MAKKTRTELSTLAINTNLPDNTQELITPTTERSQLTDERESVVNYKDDLGGAPNAGKFLTVATDGESLTMVNEPSGVPDWVTFITAVVNQMLLKSGGDGTGTSQSSIKFTSYDGSITSQINFNGIDGSFYINGSQSQIQLTTAINFIIGGTPRLNISSGGDATFTKTISAVDSTAAIIINDTNDGVLGGIGARASGTYPLQIWGGTLELKTGSSADITAATTKLTISSGGVVSIPNGIVFNNNTTGGTPNATGVTLNDYEEGTWTPTNLGSSNITVGPTGLTGTYTRIGNRVICDFKMTGITAPYTGALIYIVLAGFPFAQSPINNICSGTCLNYPNSRQAGGIWDNTGSEGTSFFVYWENSISNQSGNSVWGTITYQV
tara:strand:+ start:158 stop:1297 length:1140 start_codon:yes stop_codon:yes gene_type:complete